ncbi:hypothetical protein MYSE111917_15740 [Mycobacterium senriense]
MAGSTKAAGRIAGAAAVQPGGTDKLPTVLAWPSPADANVPNPPAGFVMTGNGDGGTAPMPGQDCTPAQPLTMSSVWKPVRAPAMSKGRAINVPGASMPSPATLAGASRKNVTRSLPSPSTSVTDGGSAAASGAAEKLLSRLGTAENDCCTALRVLPAAAPVAWPTASDWPAPELLVGSG